MIEILKETDQRLVMTLGPGPKRRARFVLDNASGQAWFERQGFLPSRTAQTALADIVAIEAAGKRLVIASKSGVRHSFAGDLESVREAAARMRAFVGLASTESAPAHPRESHAKPEVASEDPAATEPLAQIQSALSIPAAHEIDSPVRKSAAHDLQGGRAKTGKRTRQAAAVAIVIALFGVAGFKIPDFFVLPTCDAQRTRDTLHDLLHSRDSGPIRLSNFATISRTKDEYRCSAEVLVAGDRATVGYRSYWNGWSAIVRATGPLGAARLDPSRMRAIDEAYDAFMTRASAAYQSGEPPRQSEVEINDQLSTILDVAELTDKTLAGADIDEAIRWFNSGDTVGAVYLLAGTGFNDIAQLPADDAMQKKLRGNLVKFAGEFGRYLDFQVTVLAALADAQASYATGGPAEEIESAEFKRKTADIKALLAQSLKTDFISLVYDGLKDEWRMRRLDAIAHIAPVAANVLGVDELAAIRDQATQTLPYFASEAVRTRVAEVAGVLRR